MGKNMEEKKFEYFFEAENRTEWKIFQINKQRN